MARASTWACLGVAAGMTLGGQVASGATPPVLVGLAGIVGQAGRPAQAHAALNSGIDCYRRGDYEAAASFFQQAQAGKDDLSDEERQELANLVRLNDSALAARRAGVEDLNRAEAAVQAGRMADALSILKTVTTNQFLSSADRTRAQRLADELRAAGSQPRNNTRPANTVTPGVLARTKLQQARLLMAKANYDAAEALAHEADQLHLSYSPVEDTPYKVIEDINRLRSDPKKLLASARMALQAGELDRAEELAHAADRVASPWTFSHLWGDSPSKVLRDIQSERVRLASLPAPTKLASSTTTEVHKPGVGKDEVKVTTLSDPDAARQLVKDGRQALQAGDLTKAQECAKQAMSLNVRFYWWEDTPAKLQGDAQRQMEKTKGTATTQSKGQNTSSASTRPAGMSASADPRAQLQAARDLLNAQKLDEAEKIATGLQVSANVTWGLFEDSPDRLMADIRKARTKRDQEESVRLLAKARTLMEQGKYEEARAMAYRAERLHGPYGVLELGERPSHLIAEVDAAQSKARRTPTPASMMASTTSTTNTKTNGQNGSAPPAAMPSADKSSTTLVQASATDAGVKDAGNGPAMNGPAMGPPPFPSNLPLTGDTAMPSDPKAQAARLMADARRLQKEGKLVEARQKALEAQKIGITFTMQEEGPERLLLDLAQMARKRIDQLMQQATDYAATASVDKDRYRQAEVCLVEARELARGFALDSHAVDAKAAWVRQNRDQSSKLTAGSPPIMPDNSGPVGTTVSSAPATQQPGLEMLERARLELNRGDLSTARRLAVEVYSGPYNLQAQADAVIHSIDAEEFNQRILTANRSYDAAMSAFFRKDYGQAATIMHTLDLTLLSPQKQSKVREIMMVPEMQIPPRAVAQAGGTSWTSGTSDGTGKSQATDLSTGLSAQGAPSVPVVSSINPGDSYAKSGDSYVKQVQAMQEIQFQKLRDDGLRAQRDAAERFRAGEQDRAIEILQDYLDGLRQADVDQDRLALLQRPVDARLQQFKTLKAQQTFDKLQANKTETFSQLRAREAQLEEHKRQEIEDLMKQYKTFCEEGKYKEAEVVAMRAHELDPDNAGTGAAVYVAQMHRNQIEYDGIKKDKEEQVLRSLNDVEKEGPFVSNTDPLKYDRNRWETAKVRKAFPKEGLDYTVKSEKEREIERRLGQPISLDFKDTPLKQVIDDLRELTGINIVPDQPALDDENISVDRPITMHLEGVSTKSALDLLLHQAHLIYIIKDEVLQITTESHARSKLVQRTYQVVDLVIPIEDNPLPDGENLEKVLEKSVNNGRYNIGGATTPYTAQFGMPNGTPVGTTPGSHATASESPGRPMEDGRRAATLEGQLIDLIKTTIKPESWADMGGPGTIEYFPLGMALVVSQTPDIQEQVGELLTALRRLQDLEVTVEVRFITISESFYERIGLNFNVNVLTDNSRFEPLISSQQFAPFGYLNSFQPSHFVSGITAPSSTGTTAAYTPDLNIPITSSSFGPAIPPFGGFPGTPGSDGGISLGLAFLSDIQVFLFMEAAQGDRRTNVMQAPKLTLFNGQTSTISIDNQQYFVTNVVVAQAGGQLVFVPQNQPFPVGVNLTINAVVSADRRFVRLSLNPILTNIASPTTALFPITTFITPVFDNGSQGVPIPFTQYIQQPDFTQVNVRTTVNVPDGGTVLLGGLKQLSEGRNEFGPPILSKIPYIDRLFKNTGYGRDVQSLMLMVTPRVIINEEEEIKQTGIGAAGAAPGTGAAPLP